MNTPCCASSTSAFGTTGTASTSLALFRSSVALVLLLLPVLAVYIPKFPEHAHYTSSMKYASTVSSPCPKILTLIVRHKTLPDGPTSGSWSKLLSLGTARVLRALTGSTSRYNALRGIVVFRYCTAGTYFLVLSGFGSARTLIELSIWAFSVLPIFWPPVPQYSQYSD